MVAIRGSLLRGASTTSSKMPVVLALIMLTCELPAPQARRLSLRMPILQGRPELTLPQIFLDEEST